VTTVSITFHNFNDEPIYLQVDPWAGIYLLRKDEYIEIVAESETSTPSFSVTEAKNTRILTIGHSDEYYVVVDGQRVHCNQYLSNIED
jgi:hypothetical protein